MEILDPSTVEWWLPAGYIVLAVVLEILLKGWRHESFAVSRGHAKGREDEDGAGLDSIRAPLLQDNGEGRCKLM